MFKVHRFLRMWIYGFFLHSPARAQERQCVKCGCRNRLTELWEYLGKEVSGRARWTCDNSVEVLLMNRKWLIVRGTGKARCIPERRESWLVGGNTSWQALHIYEVQGGEKWYLGSERMASQWGQGPDSLAKGPGCRHVECCGAIERERL